MSKSLKIKKLIRNAIDKGYLAPISFLFQCNSISSPQVRWNVFWMYGKAAGLPSLIFALSMFGAFQGINTLSSFFLTVWTDDPQLTNKTTLTKDQFVALNEQYLGIYSSFALYLCECNLWSHIFMFYYITAVDLLKG